MTEGGLPMSELQTGATEPSKAQTVALVEYLRVDIPPELEASLRRWIFKNTRRADVRYVVVAKLQIPIFDWPRKRNAVRDKLAYMVANDGLMFVVDAVLSALPIGSSGYKARIRLADLLAANASILRIREDGKGLERHTHPVAEVIRQASTSYTVGKNASAGSAVFHLQEAFEELRKLDPDTMKAYGEAIKAVESAAHSVIERNNVKATLGTMLGVLRDKSADFEVAIASPRSDGPVTAITGMMQMLWNGQTSRHGSQTQTRSETIEEAQMAAELASILVLWFATGKVRRQS
jgi:hypothetical protein